MEEVLDSARWVAENGEQVQVDQAALQRFAEGLAESEPRIPGWNYRYHFHDGGEQTVFYLLILDTLNFCFWAPEGQEKWHIDYGGQSPSGYFALAAALKRALETGMPLADAEYLAGLSPNELRRILGGRGELQLLDRRREALNELGEILRQEYGGRASWLVEAAGRSAVELARLLARKLQSFRDVAQYGDRKVCFYKRAQIFAADLWGAFRGKRWGSFADIAQLTAFADYKLPQVLRHLGILRYGPELAQRVDRCELIEAGSLEEVELRATTVWAVESLCQELSLMGRALNAVELDWLLWQLGQQAEFKQKPHHRTLTIFY